MIKGKKAEHRVGDIVVYPAFKRQIILCVVLKVNDNLNNSHWDQEVVILFSNGGFGSDYDAGKTMFWYNNSLMLYKNWKSNDKG